MQNKPPEDAQDQTVLTSLVSSLSDAQPPRNEEKPVQPEKKQPLFYTQENDLDLHLPLLDEQEADQADQSSPFVLPFQHSAAMPTIADRNAQDQGLLGNPPSVATPANKKRWGSFHLLKLFLIGSVVLITVIGASVFVFAQSATSPTTTQGSGTNTPGVTAAKPTQAPSVKTPTPTSHSSPQTPATPSRSEQGTQGAGTPSDTLPSPAFLNQIGWTQAGLTLGDTLEALRTGSTFTDREMSYDYRNIGTSTRHSGTLTGATFLLTAGGKNRFTHNDVRMINNVLYNRIRTEKIIQQVVNAQPSLIQFQSGQVQGQPYAFAWVNVTFELLQSKIDPASGQRAENLEIDPASGQPLQHHMVVLLVRVPPQNQGENAPLGGTGWLVDTYARDSTTLPVIATDPSL